MASECLSAKDRDVLESIFSPTLTFAVECLPSESHEKQTVVNGHGKAETEDEKKAHELEVLAVKKAEEGDLECALNLLNNAVNYSDNNASLYNNRAQVFLLKGEKDAASADLEKALQLSKYQGKVAGQAFTQRALIHRLNGNKDAALKDFQMAANLGNSFAKSQVIELNPYAALCNQMLTQAIGRLRRGEGDCI